MIKVVFVCLGNICRSPMAEAVLKKMIKDENLTSKIEVYSRATSIWEHGNPVHSGTRNRLKKEGIATDGMYSKTLEEKDLSCDYIIAMDESNVANIKKLMKPKNRKEIKILLEYAGENRGIADPWYTGDFDTTYNDIKKGCEYLLKEIKEKL